MKTTRSHTTCEAHFVRHHQQGHAIGSQAAHHLQHFVHEFGIERRGNLVAQQGGGCMASARAIATRCCCPPDS
jgi:hypothetical protein